MTRLWRVALGASIVAAAAMAFGAGPFASQNPPAPVVTLRMIVVSTPDEAARIVEQLGQGADFATLAAEQSIEPTARDGGFLGTLDPATLRPELRDALRGVGMGGLTPVVRIPTGFAVLKVVPASESAGRPAASQLERLSTSASSVVYAGLSVSGLAEADAVLLAMLRRPGWGEDLQNVCEVRRDSIPAVVDRLKSGPPDVSGTIEPAALPRDLWIDAMDTQYAWAQLHAYQGELDTAIALWEHARRFADGIPDALPRHAGNARPGLLAQVGARQRRLSRAGRLLSVSAGAGREHGAPADRVVAQGRRVLRAVPLAQAGRSGSEVAAQHGVPHARRLPVGACRRRT